MLIYLFLLEFGVTKGRQISFTLWSEHYAIRFVFTNNQKVKWWWSLSASPEIKFHRYFYIYVICNIAHDVGDTIMYIYQLPNKFSHIIKFVILSVLLIKCIFEGIITFHVALVR